MGQKVLEALSIIFGIVEVCWVIFTLISSALQPYSLCGGTTKSNFNELILVFIDDCLQAKLF